MLALRWTKLSSDHPHERGDWTARSIAACTVAGSSPRAWGLVRPFSRYCFVVRIIPTSVGTGCSSTPRRSRTGDHPHERGDWGVDAWQEFAYVGSSPRAWGLGGPRRLRGRLRRIIPTSVGTGAGRACRRSPRTDHPHERGDWTPVRELVDSWDGSSPRAWGLGRGVRGWGRFGGIIPTSVGTGRPSRRWTWGTADHPHERGDWFGLIGAEPGDEGSSPRAWGLVGAAVVRARSPGIIPTSVGTGSTARTSRSGRRDHPHERGDWCPVRSRARVFMGSSPRAWGLVSRALVAPRGRGIIPTSVGTGSPSSAATAWTTDHPHERGDWDLSRRGLSASAGSSPRAW